MRLNVPEVWDSTAWRGQDYRWGTRGSPAFARVRDGLEHPRRRAMPRLTRFSTASIVRNSARKPRIWASRLGRGSGSANYILSMEQWRWL